MIGILLIAIHPKARRLGDFVAGTIVVRDRPVIGRVLAAPAPEPELPVASLGGGTPAPHRRRIPARPRLRGARSHIATRCAQAAFAAQLVARFAGRFPLHAADDLDFVRQLHDLELSRRRGRFGARTGEGSRSVAERLVARKGARWAEFQVIADRVAAGGLDALAARELPDFAARYREVAADLAPPLASTVPIHSSSPSSSAWSRLAISALYRDERQTWHRIWTFFSRVCPGAVVSSWRYVAIAYLIFIATAGAGFALLREHPALAPELIPDVMLERAEAGAARHREGRGICLCRRRRTRGDGNVDHQQ